MHLKFCFELRFIGNHCLLKKLPCNYLTWFQAAAPYENCEGYPSSCLLMVEGCTREWPAGGGFSILGCCLLASDASAKLSYACVESQPSRVYLRFYFPALCIFIPLLFLILEGQLKKVTKQNHDSFSHGAFKFHLQELLPSVPCLSL